MQTQSYKLNFEGTDVYMGIDAHLKSWTVSILVNGIICKTFSQDPSAQKLKNYLDSNYPGGNYHSAYEAGFCGFSPHRELHYYGINNIVVNPADIPTTDKEKKQKEDARDSRKIAHSLQNNQLKRIHVPDITIEGLRNLVRYRRTLVKDINRYKSRTKSFLYFNGLTVPVELVKGSTHWSKRYSLWLKSINLKTEYSATTLSNMIETVEYLRKQLLQINRQFRQIERDGEYSQLICLLRSVPGVALITSLTIITEIGTIERFSSFDKLCSFVGLVPSTNSSGDHERVGNITPRGNKQLRSMLIESAWTAIRQDPALMMRYGELCQRMDSNKAIVKIAKKLLRRIQHVLKNKEPYEKGITK